VLVRVPALQSGGVVICAEDVTGVVEAATVFGEADVILKIHAKEKEIGNVMAEMRKIPYTTNTQTYQLASYPRPSYFGPPKEFRLPRQLLL